MTELAFEGRPIFGKRIMNFQRWADDRVIDALEKISDEDFDKTFGFEDSSLRKTSAYIVEHLHLWIQRLKGISLKEFPNFHEKPKAELLQCWRDILDDLAFYFEDTVIEVVRYKTTEGSTYTSTKEDILIHLSYTAAYFRGQIMYIFQLLGKEVVDLYFISHRRKDVLA